MSKKKSFLGTLISNMSYAYISQAISTLLSVVFTLIVPKALGVEGYGYWQLIVFYATYLGIFYLGINDGLYLRVGGKAYDELDKPLIATLSRVFFLIHLVLAVLFIAVTWMFVEDVNRRYVLCAAAVFLPFFNLKGLLGQTLQAVNRTRVNAISIMVDRITIFIAVLIAMLLGVQDYRYYVVVYVVGGIVATIYCCYEAREIVFARNTSLKNVLPEVKDNVVAGVPLMLSSLAAMLIIGSSRQIIDMRWDISNFSKVSLAITMMNLFLVFLNQSSLVLFPAIRTIKSDNQIGLYHSLNKLLNIVLPAILIVYVPVGTAVNAWLPNYSESVMYLGIMLPICLFDGKMNLVNNTYFKVLRLERQLFVMNVITFALNLILSVIGAYVLNNMMFIVVGLVISIAFRSLVSEMYLSHHVGQKVEYSSLVMLAFSLLFVLLNLFVNKWIAFGVYTLLYAAFFITQKQAVKRNLSAMKAIVKEANQTTSI